MLLLTESESELQPIPGAGQVGGMKVAPLTTISSSLAPGKEKESEVSLSCPTLCDLSPT